MITTPDQFAKMNEPQRYEALARAELQRDNAELLLRECSGKAAAERQQRIVHDIQHPSRGQDAAA